MQQQRKAEQTKNNEVIHEYYHQGYNKENQNRSNNLSSHDTKIYSKDSKNQKSNRVIKQRYFEAEKCEKIRFNKLAVAKNRR